MTVDIYKAISDAIIKEVRKAYEMKKATSLYDGNERAAYLEGFLDGAEESVEAVVSILSEFGFNAEH